MSVTDLPKISLITILHDNTELYPLFQYHWDTLDYPKDKLEWIIIDDSKEDHSNLIPIHENILYLRVTCEEYLDKINFPKDEEKVIWNYFNKMKRLTNGFKRDYAVGLTSNEYIFHIDIDTIYQPNAIQRKLKFLKENRLECVYCKEMLCYDIYGKQLYKTENTVAGYESTLFHTKEFWKKGGFKWEDIISEAVSFYYNKGLERKMDNYYDTIKILSTYNINQYQPKKITIKNMNIKIPEIINTIKISGHPLKSDLGDLFYKQDINVLGINSQAFEHLKNDNWNIRNVDYDKKSKEKTLIKEIKELDMNFDLCIINTKFPIWNIFEKIQFKCIIIESEKNIEQMSSILEKKDYLNFNNLFIHKLYIIHG